MHRAADTLNRRRLLQAMATGSAVSAVIGSSADALQADTAMASTADLTQAAFDEYVRCYTLKTITGSCRDFRAAATCDFEMDAADKDRPIAMPTLVLWGARGQPPERMREFADVWRKYASNVVDTDAMPCGHYIQEEMPDYVYQRFVAFFTL